MPITPPANLSVQQQEAADERFVQAVRKDDLSAVKQAVTDGANVNASFGERLGNALYKAVAADNFPMAEYLLQQGIEANTAQFERHSALLRTITVKNPDMTKLLLEHGADPNYPPPLMDVSGEIVTPGLHALHQSAIYGDMETVKMLVSAGAELDMCASNGGSPLWYAAAQGHDEVACYLVNAGADPEARFDNTRKASAPHPAAIDAPKAGEVIHDFRTGIFRPATKNNTVMLQILLDAGADVHALDDKGRTALDCAKAEKKGAQEAEAMLERYAQYPTFDEQLLDGISKDALFAPNDDGYCFLDSPSTWRHFDAICNALEAAGEPLQVHDLLAKNKDGNSWLQRGIECFGGADLFKHCVDETGKVRMEQFVDKDGEATGLLEAVINRQHLSELFSQEVWRGNGSNDYCHMYNALPEEQQALITNYHRTKTALRAEEGIRGSITR